MRTQVRNRLLMSRQDIAAELPSETPNRRAFIGVWPLPEGGFRIWRFDVPASALADMLASDRHMATEEMLDGIGYTVTSIDEVEQKLTDLGVDSDLLDYPWKSDYPL
jgi:hypothetical protein